MAIIMIILDNHRPLSNIKTTQAHTHFSPLGIRTMTLNAQHQWVSNINGEGNLITTAQ
jgi:hypothetical protein